MYSEKLTGNNYLERVLSDKYPEHDAIHIEGKEGLFLSEYHGWKAVQAERYFQKGEREELERVIVESKKEAVYLIEQILATTHLSDMAISEEAILIDRKRFLENEIAQRTLQSIQK